MILRPRDSHSVKTDALALASQKAAAGCRECAQGYIDLARTHGATPDEIRQALEATDLRVGTTDAHSDLGATRSIISRRPRLALPLGATAGALAGAAGVDRVQARAATQVGRELAPLSPQDIARYRRFGIPLPS